MRIEDRLGLDTCSIGAGAVGGRGRGSKDKLRACRDLVATGTRAGPSPGVRRLEIYSFGQVSRLNERARPVAPPA